MKYRLGDTVRVSKPIKLKALTEDEMNEQLREGLLAMRESRVPTWLQEDYEDIVLTTQAMVDEYNAPLIDPTSTTNTKPIAKS